MNFFWIDYQILKIISQRNLLKYDESMLTVFSNLINKNRKIMVNILSSKEYVKNSMNIILLINEDIRIIKSLILHLIFFSDNLDKMQKNSKYDTVKDTIIECISLALKAGLYWKASTKEDINTLSIFNPKDFVAAMFKSLLVFKTEREKAIIGKFKFEVDLTKNFINLAADLVSRSFQTDDNAGIMTYKLYLLQFLNLWEIDIFKEKSQKMSDEMNRLLSEFGEEKDEISTSLEFHVKELALDLYVKLAKFECSSSIESILRLIRDNCTSENKLAHYLYILAGLLYKSKIQSDVYPELINGNAKLLKETFGNINNEAETTAYISNQGTRELTLIYKMVTENFIQVRQIRINSYLHKCRHY